MLLWESSALYLARAHTFTHSLLWDPEALILTSENRWCPHSWLCVFGLYRILFYYLRTLSDWYRGLQHLPSLGGQEIPISLKAKMYYGYFSPCINRSTASESMWKFVFVQRSGICSIDILKYCCEVFGVRLNFEVKFKETSQFISFIHWALYESGHLEKREVSGSKTTQNDTICQTPHKLCKWDIHENIIAL